MLTVPLLLLLCFSVATTQGRSRTNNGHALASAAAKAVMDAALSKGSRDNITVVAMLLDWGSQFDDEAAA